jgi:threonyl-tRNA synthetase
MRLITLHCDYIKFKAIKKALKSAEDLTDGEKGEKEIKDPLVVLTAVEEGDNDKILKQYIGSIIKTAKDVNAKRIVLYPYAHLSNILAKPETAKEYMVEAEQVLRKDGFEVTRAPFGYYKEFELKCKGHPLSELSKEFRVGTAKEIEKEEIAKIAKAKAKGNTSEEKEKSPSELLREISRSKLDTSKLKENDHRILGQKLDLFSFNEVAPGAAFWHDKGLIIFNELVNFWREEHRKAGYQEVSTPQILDLKLWKISGHWEKYKENMFKTEYEGRDFGVKPMNCPGGMLIYKSGTKSYKDLPLRMAELGVVHRQELSGVLAGLFRVIRITQDDAHIFCTLEQMEEEIVRIIDLIKIIYSKFNLDFDHIELSTRPEKRIGSDEMWDKAEGTLENVLKKRKIKYKINAGDGAFYGPKIDFHVKDSLGRTWQLSTIQLDFAMPERFELEYVDKDGKAKRPIMLHRVIYGSVERFVGILLEHTNGALPLWLSPVQVKVINFTDRNTKAAEKVVEKLKAEVPGIRVEADFRNATVNDKVRDSEMQKIPYLVTIGDKEEEKGTLAVKKRGEKKPEFGVKLDAFIKDLKEKIEKRE